MTEFSATNLKTIPSATCTVPLTGDNFPAIPSLKLRKICTHQMEKLNCTALDPQQQHLLIWVQPREWPQRNTTQHEARLQDKSKTPSRIVKGALHEAMDVQASVLLTCGSKARISTDITTNKRPAADAPNAGMRAAAQPSL